MTKPGSTDHSKEALLEKCRLEQEQAQLRDFRFLISMDLISLIYLVKNIQLALRHPANTGPCAIILGNLLKHISERLTEEGYPANAELMRPGSDPEPQPIADADLIERLGGIEKTQAPPIREIGPHAFYRVKGTRYCGRCGEWQAIPDYSEWIE